jgi:hypothetical protein
MNHAAFSVKISGSSHLNNSLPIEYIKERVKTRNSPALVIIFHIRNFFYEIVEIFAHA